MDLNFLIETIQNLVYSKLKVNNSLTDNDLVESVDTVLKMAPNTSIENKSFIIDTIRQTFAVHIDPHQILKDTNNKVEPWIKNEKASIKWDFWDRYRNFMNKKLPPKVLIELDNLTDDILDCIENPKEAEYFDRRGMVVGQVQSGKTGNYIGTICKAADAGYRVIIVLAGLHNNLRSQTQMRIDEGFLGEDTKVSRSLRNNHNYIGVGNLNPNVVAHALTTANPNGDFNKAAAESSGVSIGGKDPIILVIKKNAAILRNLLAWLASKGVLNEKGNKAIRNTPLLLIDDEADNASINTSKEEVTAINGYIRALLNLFDKSAYIGYTATPYANIFINHNFDNTREIEITAREIRFTVGNDIFPSDFIVNLPPPSNYIGANKIFSINLNDDDNDTLEKSKWIQLYEIIDDYNHYIPDKHKNKGDLPFEIPHSMKKAICCFFLVCAARRVRGQEKAHNSMLIHVSRFNTWQNKITELVLEYNNSQVNAIAMNDSKTLKELKQLWENEFEPTTKEIIESKFIDDNAIKPIAWDDIKKELIEATQKIQVRAVHGNTKAELDAKQLQPLDYDEYKNKGLSVICIGGDKLSRGLTLEGLSISYYLRASKFYDTLLQMGRWFGYRPGYGDLCRLFTTEALILSYKHIARASEELRLDFEMMIANKMTPSKFGLKVQTDPDYNLKITSANKSRHSKVITLDFSGELEETYSFHIDSEPIEANFKTLEKFIGLLGIPTGSPNNENNNFKNHYIWSGNNNYESVAQFISEIKGLYQFSFNTTILSKYIESEATDNNKIKNWTIAIINNTNSNQELFKLADLRVGMTERANIRKTGNIYEINKSRIISPEHQFIDLTPEEFEKAKNKTRDIALEKGKTIPNRPYPYTIREARNSKHALLLIYLLDYSVLNNNIKTPVVGLAISFPEGLSGKEYEVNTVFQSQDKIFPIEEDDYNDDEILMSVNSNIKWLNQIRAVGKTVSKIILVKNISLEDNYLFSNYFVNNYELTPTKKNQVLTEKQIAIRSTINIGFLQLLLNSSVLQFYIENTREESIITQELMNSLPIVQPTNTIIFERLADYINLLKEENKAVQHSQLSYFQRVADALILELYFPTDFSSNNVPLLQNLKENEIISIKDLSSDEALAIIEQVFKNITATNHPFNKSFYYIASLEVSKTFL